MSPRVYLVGEMNPYGADPRYALYDEPAASAGGRLRRLVLGMTSRHYLRYFHRRNLLQSPRWSAAAARAAALALAAEFRAPDDDWRAILLGARVWAAFEGAGLVRPETKWRPFGGDGPFLFLPHPSGLSRAWNEPGAIARARAAVVALAPWLATEIGAADRTGGAS